MYAPVATTMNPGTSAIATTNTGTTIALVVATMINNALALKTGLKAALRLQGGGGVRCIPRSGAGSWNLPYHFALWDSNDLKSYT